MQNTFGYEITEFGKNIEDLEEKVIETDNEG